jgi:cystathionine beta-lyase/cystathionine gamma-synthase
MAETDYPEAHLETLCAEVEEQPPSVSRPLALPIVPAAVFEMESLEMLDDITEGRAPGFIYSRDGNPTQAALERLVARLEGAEAGVACASGMGAIAAALLPGLKAGDRIVAASALYGRTLTLLNGPLAQFGVRVQFVDICAEAEVARALAEPAAAVIVETISNPLLRVPDLELLARLAHEAGARLIVDNTFATPYHCRPLAYGADVAVHSGTKFLGGHSDVTIGVVAGQADFAERARNSMSTFGAPASAFDCWLTVRGCKTLALRMERAAANAAAIAAFLAERDEIAAVFYPGLESSPDFATAARLLERGFGAMVAFELRGGAEAASAFVRGLRRIRLATSLGDVSTTISHPAKSSHRSLGAERRAAGGIGEGLIRLSAGIEHIDDLLADLEQGLAATRSIRF